MTHINKETVLKPMLKPLNILTVLRFVKTTFCAVSHLKARQSSQNAKFYLQFLPFTASKRHLYIYLALTPHDLLYLLMCLFVCVCFALCIKI